MKITVPVSTPTPVTLRDDWKDVIVAIDDPNTKTVKVYIPGTPALPQILGRPEIKAQSAIEANPNAVPPIIGKLAVAGRPAITGRDAVAATVSLNLTIWSEDSYIFAQGLRNGQGWGQSDLILAVEATLEKLRI